MISKREAGGDKGDRWKGGWEKEREGGGEREREREGKRESRQGRKILGKGLLGVFKNLF